MSASPNRPMPKFRHTVALLVAIVVYVMIWTLLRLDTLVMIAGAIPFGAVLGLVFRRIDRRREEVDGGQ